MRWAVVAALTLLGAVLRLRLSGQSLFADELSTWWIVEGRSLRGVVATVATDAEITPPLYFALAWFGRRLGDAPELLRAPSWIAGIALIPLVYAVGERTVGRPAALVAAALTTFGPFAIYYAADARGYALMMAAVVLSTLAMLLAVDSGRRRWWVVHGVAVAAGVLSHYTSVFAFAAQLGWVLWAHPEARRSALAATAGAVALFSPWTGGLLADLDSPTTQILAALSPFTWASVRFSLTHWVIGYPAAIAFGLGDFPGVAAVGLLVLAAVLAAGGSAARALRTSGGPRAAGVDRRVVLIVLLALSGPGATALLDPLGVHLFSVRNLAASWPAAALAFAALLVAPRRRVAVAAVAIALAAFAVAAVQLSHPRFANPDYAGAAGFVDRQAGPRDVVIDATGELSPGPATGLDVVLERPHRVLRAAAPEVRDRPFGFFDPVVRLPDAIRRAVAEAGANRVLLVSTRFPPSVVEAQIANERARARRDARFPASHRLVDRRTFPGVLGVEVRVYAPRAP